MDDYITTGTLTITLLFILVSAMFGIAMLVYNDYR